ncbi:MAG TPA: GNAT family N-acetyltransferase [Thermoguttaceae bacterium]|nr:GNAT family N-acetyltransferase [Thermoguttaceae bacterium]
MRVHCLYDLDELAPYADDWDRLAAGVPFRSWAWLSTWWRHYGLDDPPARGRKRLFVVCVFDHTDRLLGLAPWYRDFSASQGHVLRPLGSGEVCSDYLGVLCQPGMEYQVTQAVADYLTADEHAGDCDFPRWDLLQLADFDAEDHAVGQLIRRLAEQGNTVHRQTGPNCWRIELPTTWEEYLATLSKNRRKLSRRLQRSMLDTGRAVLHHVERAEDLAAITELLIDLHQRRRHSLGEPGCFASPRFTAFHREVMPVLFRQGQLQLSWLELDGRPAAAEYHLAGDGVVYAYQSGVDPDVLDLEPGNIFTLATLRRAIEKGYRAVDFLRGDEPYKAHFRARPRPSLSVRVVPGRTTARVRHNLWLAGSNVKQWIKSGLRLVGTGGE